MRTPQELLDLMKKARMNIIMYAVGALVFFIATFVSIVISPYLALALVLVAAFMMFRLLSIFGKQQALRAEFRDAQLAEAQAKIVPVPMAVMPDGTTKPKMTRTLPKTTPFGKPPF